MPSRDRLREGEMLQSIEIELAEIVRNHPELRKIREIRIRQEKQALLSEDKPLGDLLQDLINETPTLSKLFISGTRLSNPFNLTGVGKLGPFVGKQFPTFFNVKGVKKSELFKRSCKLGSRCRITFETDAENQYFRRDVQPGTFTIISRVDKTEITLSHSVNLFDGIAALTLTLPADAKAGDSISIEVKVTDESQIAPFVSPLELVIEKADETDPDDDKRRKKRRKKKKKPNKNGSQPDGLSLPMIVQVAKEGKEKIKAWTDLNPVFDENSALRIIHAGSDDDSGDKARKGNEYIFYVNIDNISLNNEIKDSDQDAELMRSKFIYAHVLLGLAYINYSKTDDSEDGGKIEDDVEMFSKAISPVLVPMIDGLSELDLEVKE
jgi:hypothetical protein